MAYATITDVSARNRGRATFTASTKPTASEVGGFIDQSAGVLDGILRRKGYSLPIPTTATAALAALKEFNAIGAAYEVERAAQSSERLDADKAMWDWAQKMLLDGLVELDAPREPTTAKPRSSFDGTATPFFTRDMLTY